MSVRFRGKTLLGSAPASTAEPGYVCEGLRKRLGAQASGSTNEGRPKMADEVKQGEQTQGGASNADSKDATGDPGRTPGKAEGDEETVDESLRRKENRGQ